MRTAALVIGVAMISSALVAAQGGTMAKDKMKNMKDVSVSGCVAEGPDGHFMLNNAMMMGAGMKDEMKKDEMMSYDLKGGTNLKAHVGHKVEVMGSLDPAMMKSDKMAMGKEKMAKPDKGAMGMAGDMHGTIDVKSVKMVSATCP